MSGPTAGAETTATGPDTNHALDKYMRDETDSMCLSRREQGGGEDRAAIFSWVLFVKASIERRLVSCQALSSTGGHKVNWISHPGARFSRKTDSQGALKTRFRSSPPKEQSRRAFTWKFLRSGTRRAFTAF